MKIHEFQAKEILARYGVRIPRGKVTQSPAEAYEIARSLGGVVAVKAQVHAGGRGKGGGVRIVRSPEEAERRTREMLGTRLVTPQTGAGRNPGASGPDRGGTGYPAGVLPGHGHRPEPGAAGAHGQHRRGHGNRGGGREDSRIDPEGAGEPGLGTPGLPGKESGLRPRSGEESRGPGRRVHESAFRSLCGDRRLTGGDQPAGPDRRRRFLRLWTPR